MFKQEKIGDAKQVMANALGSTELQEISIPIPFAIDQTMIALASTSVKENSRFRAAHNFLK